MRINEILLENKLPTTGINVRVDKKAGIDYAGLIVDGKKHYESRRTDSLRPYVGKTVAIIRTGAGQATAIGQATIGEPIVVDATKFDKLRKKHLVPAGSSFDIEPDSVKYLYPMIDPVRWDNEMPITSHGIVSRKVSETVNPDILHPDFHHEQEIGDYRYEAFYYKPHKKNPAKLRIECYDGDKRAGVATFSITDDALVSDVTQVRKKYQGKKIATTMYAYAKMLGNDIIPSAELTDDGKAMWDAWHKSGEAAHIVPKGFNKPKSNDGDET